MDGATDPARAKASVSSCDSQVADLNIAEPGYLRPGQMCRHIGISRSHWHRVVKPALVAADVETLPVGQGIVAWSVPQTKAVLRDVFGGAK